jgi:hypothetical protein
MPSINNLPPLTNVTGTVAFPVVDYSVDPDATKRATFLQFRDYLETTAAVKSVAGRIGVITLSTSDIAGLNIISWQGIQPATANAVGGVKIGGGLNVTSSGTLSLNTSTLISTAVSIITTATANTLGAIKIGANLSVSGDGTLSATSAYTLTTATTSTLGGVKIGNGIAINNGVISTTPLTTATTSTLGGIIVGTGLTIDNSGVLSAGFLSANLNERFLNLNFSNNLGYISTGGGLPQDAGIAGISIRRDANPEFTAPSFTFNDNYYITDGTTSTRGIWATTIGFYSGSGLSTNYLRVYPGTAELNIFGSNDPTAVMSVKGTTNYEDQVTHDDHIPNKKYVDISITSATSTTATSTTLGGVKIGSGITADGDGTISVISYTLTTATDSLLGGVKIGSGINAEGDGTISVTPYTLNTATTSVLGGVKIGAGVTIDVDGTISVTPSGGSLSISDEGSNLSTSVSSINFIGEGVTATNVSNAITVRIDGGGGGGGATFTGGAVVNSTQFLNATASSSSSTGAVSIVGGIGVGGNVYVNNYVTANGVTATSVLINGVTAATSTTGALVVAGGVSVGGSVYVANTVTAVTFANAGAGTPTIQSPSSIILDAQTEVKVLGSPFTLWSRTVAQLLVTSATAGAMAYCTDESGGAVPVFYDGSNWRRVTDRNIIS